MTDSSRKVLALVAVAVSVVLVMPARAVPVEEFGRSVARALQE